MVFFIRHIMRRSDEKFEKLEKYLEGLGKWDTARKLRLFVTRQCGVRRNNIPMIISLIEIDIHIQGIVQREAFLEEECQSLYHKRSAKDDKLSPKDGYLTEDDELQLQSWLSELEDLNKEYW